jgi:hypothetical protein
LVEQKAENRLRISPVFKFIPEQQAMVWELEYRKVKYHHICLNTNALAAAVKN